MLFLPARVGITVLLAGILRGQFSANQFVAEDPTVRQTALRELAALSQEEKGRLVPELILLMEGKDGYRVLSAFAKVGTPAVVPLTSLLSEPNRSRGFAAQALATIRPIENGTVTKLRSMLKDPDVWVRRAVAESLLSIGFQDGQAISVIREMWADMMPDFGKPAYRSTTQDLVKALKDDDAEVRADAAEALQFRHVYGSDVEAEFILALADASSRVRECARGALRFMKTEAAMDALLQDEIAEVARKISNARLAQSESTRLHSLAEILALVPSDPDHKYPLEPKKQFKLYSLDGIEYFVVLHSGPEREDILRIWQVRNDRYQLIKEHIARDATAQLNANGFVYGRQTYLHTAEYFAGNAGAHEDHIFRMESTGLIELKLPKSLPMPLPATELTRKAFYDSFDNDKLEFSFDVYKDDDPMCCPSAGSVTGTYKIVGDELRYADWQRTKNSPDQQ